MRSLGLDRAPEIGSPHATGDRSERHLTVWDRLRALRRLFNPWGTAGLLIMVLSAISVILTIYFALQGRWILALLV